MANSKLVAHGSEAGYRAEIKRGPACERCGKAHRVYQRQYRAKGKAQGLRYAADQVIDHLYGTESKPRPSRVRPSSPPPAPAEIPAETPELNGAGSGETESGPSVGDRLAARIGELIIGSPEQPEYVTENDTGYVEGNEELYDDPGPGWEPAEESDYVINAAGLKLIEENLGTYLSIVGMTVEMIDPFCGPVLAANFDKIVSRWSKVIAHYPKAAELFLDGKGGTIFTWIGAIQATWPVLYAIYQHHLAKSVVVAPNGRIYNKRDMGNSPNGVDATMPPMQPQFSYSAT